MKNPFQSIAKFFGKTAETARRYPLTAFFLTAAAAVICVQVLTDANNMLLYKAAASLAVSAWAGAALQTLSERKGGSSRLRLVFTGCAAAVAALLFLASLPLLNSSPELMIRAAACLFAAEAVLIWIPTYSGRADFNRAVFSHTKAVLTAVLYAGVISAGISVIILSINALLFTVDNKVYLIALALLWILFAPMSYLASLPDFSGRINEAVNAEPAENADEKKAVYSHFVHTLLSLILLPLFSVFTLILIAYAVKILCSSQWTNSALQPFVTVCSAFGMFFYIFASNYRDKISKYYRLVFPKALILLLIFQFVSVIRHFSDFGITEGVYYTALFALFSLVISIVFCFAPLRKNGIAAPMAAIFALLSILPPVDAFTVSRTSQIAVAQGVLVKDNMLQGGTVIPDANISLGDKQKIVNSVGYLIDRGYTSYAPFLPRGFSGYGDFEKVFGFSAYNFGAGVKPTLYISFISRKNISIDIKGYDIQLSAMIYDGTEQARRTFTVDGIPYRLSIDGNEMTAYVRIERVDGGERTQFELFSKMIGFADGGGTSPDATEPLIFETEGDAGKMKIVIYEFYAAVENGAVFRNVNMNMQVYFAAP